MTDESRIEQLLDVLIDETGEYEEPQSRSEAILKACIDGSGIENCEPPQSRIEKLLYGVYDKISQGGSSLLELTTTFKADGETVYIASCNGDSYISLPPEPTSTSGSFVGWTNADGDIVDFPYFPDGNNTLEAKFSSKMITTANTVFGRVGTSEFKKMYDGEMYLGYQRDTFHNFIWTISPISENATVTSLGMENKNTLVVDGVTWHWRRAMYDGEFERLRPFCDITTSGSTNIVPEMIAWSKE